jgi:hypothetical protein
LPVHFPRPVTTKNDERHDGNMTIPEPMIDSSAAPMETVTVISGFALGLEGSLFKSARTLRIEIEVVRLRSPSQIKKASQERTSIHEADTLIEGETGPTYVLYQGEIQIEKARYKLVDMDIRRLDSGVVMKAGLADIRDCDESFPLHIKKGNLIGEIETKECGGTAKGLLVINQGIFSGRYTVRLDTPIKY